MDGDEIFWPEEMLACLGAFAELRKATISFVESVRPSTSNTSVPTGRIFMKLLWPTTEHSSRCRCKAMAVWRLRGAPTFGDPRKSWVLEFLPNIFYRRLVSVVRTVTRLRGLDDPRFAFRRG